MRRCLLTISATVAVCLASAPAAFAAPASYAGASTDGGTAFFTTSEKLVPGDTDNRPDVYVRSFDGSLGSYVTREVSTGPIGGNDAFSASYDDASADGFRVFFSTDESLVAADTDKVEDVYVRELNAGTTKLVSQGDATCAPGCGIGPSKATFVDATSSGGRVFLVSDEQLSPEDTDSSFDVYVRDLNASTTTLVSIGAASCAPGCGNGAGGAVFQGASADGARALFSTSEQLASGDGDVGDDIYQRDLGGETTSLVSAAGSCPVASCAPTFGGISADGSHVFFETNDRISGADTDSSSDVYDWSGGAPVLVSTGPTGPNGVPDAVFGGTSANGATVVFSTTESLVAEDTDATTDVYERAGGVTTLTSTGPESTGEPLPAAFQRISSDGSRVIFNIAEQLTSADLDDRLDVYERSGGITTLISLGPSGGNGAFDTAFAGVSGDGLHVFFDTAEPLVSQDLDGSSDVYERSAGTTTLVSIGSIGQAGAFDPSLRGVSQDGGHAFFIADERLAVDDLDTESDVYDRSGTGTLLVSVGNSIVLGPATPALTGTNPVSPNASLAPFLLGQADAGTSIKVYATADCSGAPVATGTSTALGGAGIPLSVEAGSTTTFRATATDENGDTSACSTDAVVYQASAPGGPGGGEEGGGSGPGGGGKTPDGGKTTAPGGGSSKGEHHVVPQTRITFAPAFRTRVRRPVFRFADITGQDGTTYLCKVDRQRWRGCSSPQRLKPLRQGRHVFKVIGANSGLSEPQPVTRKFKVVDG